jgi:hypothetical protein
MADNNEVQPSVSAIVERTYVQLLKNVGWDALSVVRRHKFKSIVLAFLLYGTYKTYGLYRSFKDMTSGMSDLLDNRQSPAENLNLSPSEKALLNYLTS